MKKSPFFILLATILTAPAWGDPATAPAAPPAPPATQPAAQPALQVRVNRVIVNAAGGGVANNILDQQRQNIRAQAQHYDSLPVVATYKQEELVKLSVIDGILRADTSVGSLPRGQSHIKVEDSPSTWLVNIQNVGGGFGAGTSINLSRYDFDKVGDEEMWLAQLNMNDNYLMLTAQGVGFNLTYNQMNNMVYLNAMKLQNGRYQSVFQLTAPSLLRLVADHPDEVGQYLVPLLRRFAMQDVLLPGPADVYTVFGELPAQTPVSQRLAELLPRLDADLFTERDAASKELARLGAPGILAALRMNRAVLSEEQKGRVDAFIASGRRRSIDDPEALRRDRNFLVDCLEDSDPAVRGAAKSSLERVLGRAVPFDVSADAGKRASAAGELRKLLKKEQDVKATTNPAAGAAIPVDRELFNMPPAPALRK